MMSDEEFKELEEKYQKELNRRTRFNSIKERLELLKNKRNLNPNIKVGKIDMPLTEEQKVKVCDLIISMLEETLNE